MDLDTLHERAKDVRLRIHRPDATPHCIGENGPVIEWHLRKPKILRAILKHPERSLGTTYVRGDWDIDPHMLPQLLQTLLPDSAISRPWYDLCCVRRLLSRLPRIRRPRPTARWYDTSLSISRACLGEERQTGCAWFTEAGIPLEQAQRIQRRRLLRKLQLREGQRVLDINAGWGSLALYMARELDVQVTGIVQSGMQLQFAQQEARRQRLEGRAHFRHHGSPAAGARFDRILAGGFLEQLPESTCLLMLQRLEACLQDDGMAWLQFTVRSHHTGVANHWLQRQMQHRRNLPLLSDVLQAAQATRLRPLHLEDRSAHWRQTLQAHSQRFARQRSTIVRRFGEALTRYWEFLLASQVTALRRGQINRYDLLLGNRWAVWPPNDSEHQPAATHFPAGNCTTLSGPLADRN